MTNIIMLGRNRSALTKQSIESLYANTPGDGWTLTYVDDGSDDFRCLRYIRSITKKNFTILEVSTGSSHVLSQLKNLGAYYSEQRWGRGDWLYFSDNDVWFSPGWLPKMIDTAELTEPDGFRLWGGQVHPFHQPKGPPISCGTVDAIDGKNIRKNATITEHSILDGPSWLMRWGTWDKYGPFQRTTAPGPCQSEEYPFCQGLTMPVAPRTEYEKYIEDNRGVMTHGGGRIGVIHPHCVIHTGLTQSNGHPAPGAAERRALIPQGVLAE